MGVNSTMNVNGFNPSCQNISSGTGLIPSSDWNVSVGNISVNWQSEDSIFHAGVVIYVFVMFRFFTTMDASIPFSVNENISAIFT